jgi:hypothetical protein
MLLDLMWMIHTLNVVSISQTTELLLSRGIPSVETDLSKVGVECDRVHLHVNIYS